MAGRPVYDLLVIGGGAAGFFGALEAARLNPNWQIGILEKTGRLLAKVAVSGGGRCNVTHNTPQPARLATHYPRGARFLKKIFQVFHAQHTIQWFAERGVALKTEEDGRMFPVTDSSQTIIDCFLCEAAAHRIDIFTFQGVERVEAVNGFDVYTATTHWRARRLLLATGGHAKPEAYAWLQRLGIAIRPPIPSLFTFNDPLRRWSALAGISVSGASVRIEGTTFTETGPVLITHWGLSGPAIIKLSAWAAEYLHQQGYVFSLLINWVAGNEEKVRQTLQDYRQQNGKRQVARHPAYPLPARLWQKLCADADIEPGRIWSDTSQKQLNRLVEKTVRSAFAIRGKTTFKEEFVTCGGISLDEIDPQTMALKKIPNLYAAGEVLDIDGETGGFNFQAAWSTAAVAARSMA
jgi:predicted Rossmann fold flavoprotein